MAAKELFRKSALEKLASPEQLDVMMQITSPKGWIALAGVGVVLLLVVLWGIFGSVSVTVGGQGILMRGDAVLAISSTAAGQLTAVNVRAGDFVEQDQVVAEIAQGELSLVVDNQQRRLDDLIAQNVESTRREDANLAQSLSALDAEVSSIQRGIGEARRQIGALEERARSQEDLVNRGLQTRGQLLATRNELAAVRQAINSQEVRLAQIESERSALERQIRQTQEARQAQIDDVRRELSQLSTRQASASVIRSPHRGRVLEVTADRGTLLMPGMPLLTLESDEMPLEAVLYVSAAEGKLVEPGMMVRVSPATVRPEEFGFMIGRVRRVSEFPVSPEGLLRVLRNESLVQTLTGGSAPIEVVAELLRDEATPSGFEWSSSQGPPSPVFSGTIAQGTVIVERRRPISYVIPLFRRSLGLG